MIFDFCNLKEEKELFQSIFFNHLDLFQIVM